MLRAAAPFLNEPIAQSESFADYVGAIASEYLPNITAQEYSGSPREIPPGGRPDIRDIWKRFAWLSVGEMGGGAFLEEA